MPFMQFTEELNQVTGAMGLYNESLGTTSDLYQYDRLRGREVPQAAPAASMGAGGRTLEKAPAGARG